MSQGLKLYVILSSLVIIFLIVYCVNSNSRESKSELLIQEYEKNKVNYEYRLDTLNANYDRSMMELYKKDLILDSLAHLNKTLDKSIDKINQHYDQEINNLSLISGDSIRKLLSGKY